MPKRTTSKISHKPSNAKQSGKPRARPAKSTRLGRTLVAGMTQVLAHVRGETQLESYYLPGPVDVKAIRRKAGMSQSQFASAFALSKRTLQEWEQGKASPDGTVRAYLTVIDRNPTAVVAALRG
jgi:putative transcriptional regulator